MKLKPIFSEIFLSQYLSDFHLSSISDTRNKILMIKELIEELESGKIESLKEEEVKSRFLNTFFGDILGFNYGNSNKWLLREEKKSTTDGTKSDGTLGYFFIERLKDDVRAVIELKDAKTDLDTKQNRANPQTPIEQAFSYASKAGGKCKWVIVSNIKEIRFYPSLDQSKCQIFILKELIHEDKLKELFFLFHKDRFIKENNESSTDRLFKLTTKIKQENDNPIHIIDKLYTSLKHFEDFGFVNPNYIASIPPFNILDEYVWHYHNNKLFTINKDIYNLLTQLTILNGDIDFTSQLKKELSEANVIDAKNKIIWIFYFLNICSIYEITAIKDYQQIKANNKNTIGFGIRHMFSYKTGEEGISKNIQIIKNESCDCILCNFRSFDFNKLLRKLKTNESNEDNFTLEYAYAHYLVATNNFKITYNIYKALEKKLKEKQNKSIKYFLVKQNLKNLHNLIIDYWLEDRETIINDIKTIDLNKVIYDEIEFNVCKEVKDYLIQIKEDALIYRIQDNIEIIISKIEDLKQLYDNGGSQTGPDYHFNLTHNYYLLYRHVNSNYIIYDAFTRYKSIVKKVFNGLIIHSHIPQIGITQFNEFFLTEAILHISPTSLHEILKHDGTLNVDDNDIEILLEKLNNFTSSIFKQGVFNDPYENEMLSIQLNYFKFGKLFTNIFSNFFIIFSKLNISKEQFKQNIPLLIKFLKIEKELAHYDLKHLSNFIIEKGCLFKESDLMEILKIAVNNNKYGNIKYHNFIKNIPKTLIKFYPEYRINNEKLIKQALLSLTNEDESFANYKILISWIDVCNDKCKDILFNAFEETLDKKFDSNFYELLLLKSSYDYNKKNYFKLYTEYTSKYRKNAYRYGLTDMVFINYVIVIYKRNIGFDKEEIKLITNLNDYETWLLNPIKFDYKKFNATWLIDLNESPIILSKLREIKTIPPIIEEELKVNFNSILAEIKYTYF